jgi:hypothetical protein
LSALEVPFSALACGANFGTFRRGLGVPPSLPGWADAKANLHLSRSQTPLSTTAVMVLEARPCRRPCPAASAAVWPSWTESTPTG